MFGDPKFTLTEIDIATASNRGGQMSNKPRFAARVGAVALIISIGVIALAGGNALAAASA